MLFFAAQATLAVQSSPAPVRRLVYSFTRSVGQNATVRNDVSRPDWQQTQPLTGRSSQTFVASGEQVPQQKENTVENADANVAPSRAGALVGGHADSERTGTIAVDVLRQQADGGLVVSIGEQTKPANVAPATCVVYGNTSLACDPARTLNPEEYSLLRFLGSNFIDPSSLDAQRHWHIAQSGGGLDTTADYGISHADGANLTVTESQTITPKTGSPTTVKSTIEYDFKRSVPTSIDERVTQTKNGVETLATTVRTVLQLVSDSQAHP